MSKIYALRLTEAQAKELLFAANYVLEDADPDRDGDLEGRTKAEDRSLQLGRDKLRVALMSRGDVSTKES